MQLYPSITGGSQEELKKKIEEVESRNITEIPLFIQRLHGDKRKGIYNRLLSSDINSIPLVHINNEMSKKELQFLEEEYNTKYFTIHESGFEHIDQWEGFKEKLYLEMQTDDIVKDKVKVDNIGGFCVDLAHYQKQKDRETIDYEYVYKRRNQEGLFKCNHLSGYAPEDTDDLHFVEKKEDFDYITNLPDFTFGEIVAIEVDNSIKRQLEFKEYISKLLDSKF